MTFYRETLGLSDAAFSLLRNLIQERTGLFYDDRKRDVLADKLTARALECGFDSFLDYYYFLKYDEKAAAEWGQVMDALAVYETYFWREMDQIHALVDVVVPEYFAARRPQPLRIWSAGCATGEEPLTIAMALYEAGWFVRAPIEIYASDASPSAIQKAQRGVYRERSFRSLPAALRAKYFTRQEDGWRVAPHLRSRVQWATANLLAKDQIAPFASSPVIFCRNVFIYFSPHTIRQVVHHFHERMPSPGYLFVAAAESLLRVTQDFELQEIGGAFVYVKREA
jgi:chemotaxis protein methyltransferase CheR